MMSLSLAAHVCHGSGDDIAKFPIPPSQKPPNVSGVSNMEVEWK